MRIYHTAASAARGADLAGRCNPSGRPEKRGHRGRVPAAQRRITSGVMVLPSWRTYIKDGFCPEDRFHTLALAIWSTW